MPNGDATITAKVYGYYILYYPISGQTKQVNFLLKHFEKGCKEIGMKFHINNYWISYIRFL